ncbi:MAG: hypothetical protein A2234_01625 [Elusimicrobia bacterium RIFOXYA2_FULL_58_8]|nr:MAG: hypothetical protein A2285_09770 [Elusimicrobia bacterium RIFOXYA12_FULL_57_11]OGS13974.1 MAG: hypothetical protein A2234_01625 [Elusimicrobia bacterium RIFOXYA2_FULL_58_8]
MKTVKTIIGIILAPAALATAWVTVTTLGPALGTIRVTFPLLAGALAFTLLHAAPVFSRGSKSGGGRFYVAGHELTHALAAVFSGIRVRKISVRSRSGYVLLDSSNMFISLAPYFIPLYTLAVSAAYWLACRFYAAAPLRPWFLAAAGFTLAFHLLHTADILAGPVQSDLKKAGGPVFSLPLLLLLNCLGLAAALKLMFPELLSLKAYSTRLLAAQNTAYSAIFSAGTYIAMLLAKYC